MKKGKIYMHITEGILPLKWAGVWYVVSAPFVAMGLMVLKAKTKGDITFKIMLGMVGAAVFVISCMPVPVPTAGTCSHPCGTGISGILLGPIMSIFVTSIALLIQALFMAHGGITTWGADIVSMGIVGSYAGFLTFRGLTFLRVHPVISAFVAGVLADWATYLTTSFELASALKGDGSFWTLFWTILVAFIPTQLPLGILEGAMTGGMVGFMLKRRPDILRRFGIIK